MDFSFKNSFKSNGSFKHSKKISIGGASQTSHEEIPILSDHDIEDHHYRRHSAEAMSVGSGSDRKEVILKIDEGDSGSTAKELDPLNHGARIWREPSYDVWHDEEKKNAIGGGGGGGIVNSGGGSGSVGRDSFYFVQGKPVTEDPPSKLIGQFLHKQRASGDMSLDMDLDMDELQNDRNIQMAELSKEMKFSFQPQALDGVEISANETVRRRHKDLPEEEEVRNSDEEVVRCTSNSSFQRDITFQGGSSLLKAKAKSRLLDPPEDFDKRSGQIPRSGQVPRSGMVQKSGQLRSGFMGRGEDEEDDPFMDEDVPEELRKGNLNALTLLQWLSLVLIVAALACTLSIPFMRHMDLWKLKLWKWEVLVLVLICGRLVSGWGIRLVVFFFERNFLLRKRVLYFVYGVRKAVQNCLWLGLVLLAWHFLFDKRVERETGSDGLRYVTKVLVCFLVGTLIWLVKTLIVKVLASHFHVSTYFDRIQDSLFNQYVIETLSGPPLIEIEKTEEDEERLADEVQKLQNAGATMPPDLKAAAFPSASPQSARSSRVLKSGILQKSPRKSSVLSRTGSKKEEPITIDHLHKWNPRNISAWNMKRLMNIVRHGSLSTLDEQILDSRKEDDTNTQIRSEVEAKAAAKKIFQNVARRGSKYIYLEDLMRFMREDEALKTTSLFEGASETRKISKSSLKNWVVNAFRERRALALTLNDTKTAVKQLHRMVNITVAIIIMVIWLLILGIATSKFLLFVSSQLVLVAFIFGNTCKTVFEAIVFLFVMHPFDVGDRCEIENIQMVVEEMNILTTVFLRYDNAKIIFPNSVLLMKPIHNFYRSPDMGDGIEFCIHIATPADKIAAIKQRITSYIENKKEHWYPAPMIIMKELEDLNRIRMAVWLCHTINHQDMGERFTRRAQLIEEMVHSLHLEQKSVIETCNLNPEIPHTHQQNWKQEGKYLEFVLFYTKDYNSER